MSHITFEVDHSMVSDEAIIEKVEAGCELLKRIFLDPEFYKWVSKFQWQTNDGQTFRRFYHSCGRNNEQIFNSIVHGQTWENVHSAKDETDRHFTVVLCQTVDDYQQNCKLHNTICLDLRYLDNRSYTPIHLAAALCQEYCIQLGYRPRGNELNECWSKFTVPVAMARIVRDVAVLLSREDYQIMQWCMLNDAFQFDYQPCSFTFGLQQLGKDIYNNKNAVDLSNENNAQNGNSSILTSLSN